MDGINKQIHIILNLSPQIGWDLSGCKRYVSRLLERYQKYGVLLKDARRQYMAVGKKVMKEKLELLAEELNDLG